MSKHHLMIFSANTRLFIAAKGRHIVLRCAVDAHTADRWGRLMAQAGRPLPAIDGLLAATASQHDLTLVTRNIKDFAGLEVRLLNPWGQH